MAPLFVQFAGVESGDRVLDVGCGTGFLTWKIVRTTAASIIIGIDASKPFLEYARSQYADARLTFEVGDAQKLTAYGSFDGCLSMLVMRHILDAFLKTREEPIAVPLETIRKIAEARQFSQKLTDDVVSSYLIEPEPNRFGLINAFSNAAQKLGPLRRIEMERFAGTLLEGPLQ